MSNKLTKKLKSQFLDFLEYHPPKRFSRHLRQMFFEYLESGLSTGFPYHCNDLVYDLEGLFELLDVAEDELKKMKKRERKKASGGVKEES